MADENQSTGDSAQQSDQTATPSLEELAAQLPPAPQQTQQTAPAQSQPATQQQPPAASPPPDPQADPEAWTKWQAEQVASTNAALKQVQDQLAAQQAQARAQAEEADISRAVDVLAEKLPGVERDDLEAILMQKYARDKHFKQLWERRETDEAKFNAALGVIAEQKKGNFAVKVDSQVAENQRAMQRSVSSIQSGAQQTDENAEWKGLKTGEFSRKFEDLMGGSN